MILLNILIALATAPLLWYVTRILLVRSPSTRHSALPIMGVISGGAALALTALMVIGFLGGGFAEAQYHAAILGW